MRTDLIAAVLTDAAATRGSLSGAVFHADHGAAAWPDELSGRRELFHWATRYNTR